MCITLMCIFSRCFQFVIAVVEHGGEDTIDKDIHQAGEDLSSIHLEDSRSSLQESQCSQGPVIPVSEQVTSTPLLCDGK